MEENTIANTNVGQVTALSFEPGKFIEKYEKAYNKTREKVGANYTSPDNLSQLFSLFSLNPQSTVNTIAVIAKKYSPQNAATIDSIAQNVTPQQCAEILPTAVSYAENQNAFFQAVNDFIQRLKAIATSPIVKQAMIESLIREQYNFASQLSDYIGLQQNFFGQPSTMAYFLRVLQEQMTFETDENGEKIRQFLDNRYLYDENFSKIYENLTKASNNEQDLLSTFQLDCTIMSSQIPSVDPTITMKI